MEQLKFQALKYRIFGKSDEEVAEMIKPLEVRFAQVRKLKTSNPSSYLSIMKYLLYLYDPNTDLNREFVLLSDRKQEAAKLSGLIKIQDLSYLDRILESRHPETLDVIQIILGEVFHNLDMREWHTLHEELDEYTSARWEKIESTRRKTRRRKKDSEMEISEVTGHNKASMETMALKSKLRDECKRIREAIHEINTKIFGDNQDIKEIAYQSRFTNPESFSRAQQQQL